MSEPHYTQTASLKDGHSKGITSVVFNSDGSLLATAGLDGTACVWDTKNWQLVDIYYAKTAITSLVWFSNDALICGLEDGVLSSLTKDGEVSSKLSFVTISMLQLYSRVSSMSLVSGHITIRSNTSVSLLRPIW